MTDNMQIEPSFNFSIEDSGASGDQTLLEGLFSPETASASPKDIKPLEDKDEPKVTPAKPEEKTPKQGKDDNEDKTPKKTLEDLLIDEEETTDDDEEVKLSKKTPAQKTPEEDTDDDNGNQFASLAKDLLQLGVFSEDEDEGEINTPEQFLEKFNKEKQKGANQIIQNFLGQFGEDYQKAFQAIYVNGVDPKDYFTTYTNIVNFSELDITKESNQEKVIRQALADQEFDQEDIEAEIERLKNYGDLETTATRHHKVLVKKEAQKLAQLEQQAQAEQEQKRAHKAQYVQNVSNILQDKVKAKDFDGIPINPKLAEEVQDFLITDKYKLPSGETITEFDKAILELKNPMNHTKKVKVALLLKVLEKDPTLSTIQKAAITKKTDSLFSETIRHKNTTKTTIPSKQTSWFQQS